MDLWEFQQVRDGWKAANTTEKKAPRTMSKARARELGIVGF